MNALIRFFCKKHLLVNLITLIVLIGGVFAWQLTSKEELPDITFNTIRISTTYSGASAEDVEFYVTKPLEEVIQGIDGIYRLTSTSSSGRSNISVELDRFVKDIDKVLTEIQSQVSSVPLPEDIINEPRVRVFETSKKAIIDIALYDESKNLLDVPSRMNLQNLARGLESKLLSQPEVFEVRRSGYLTEEVNVNVNPKKFSFYEIPLTDIGSEIQRNHVRAPSGTLKSGRNEQITVLSELDSKEKLDAVVVQGGFDSKPVKLKSIATITDSFEEQTTIYKVNGREAVMFNVVKNSRFGILEALDKVREVTKQYEQTVLDNTSVKVAFLDDESIDVRNRLSIVSSNGLLGFCLIVLTLFIFLNKRSGFWVALGIPFTLCFTLIAGYFLGYTINGITLAGIIIVLGIVVDDAIIVAENISRKLNEGLPLQKAAVEGTLEVIPPIIASVITTCVAFIPLFFFSGRFGNFVMFIPPIIFLMLAASLFESFFLLPSHMTLVPKKHVTNGSPGKIWFRKWEDSYEKLLKILLPKRYWIGLFFLVLMIGTGFLIKSEFKFVMFPDEESREIVLSGIVTAATTSNQTAKSIQPIEDFLQRYIGKEGIAIRSNIARGRRGDAARENQFRITLEITPFDQRIKTTEQLISEIKSFTDQQKELSKVRFRKRRFGQSSGSAFEIVVAENNDNKRDSLIQNVMAALKKHSDITNVEEDIIPSKKEYIIQYDQEQLKQLSVNPANISSTLRTILNGKRLYTLFRNDEEIEVKLTVDDTYRQNIESVLSVPIPNNRNYLIPLRDLVSLQAIEAKSSIRRQNMKRSSFVYSDLKDNSSQSPLEIAEEFEQSIFPKLLADYPSSQIYFEGEVIDTRESKRDFLMSILAVLGLIYVVLAVLFDSVIKPLRIMLVIPFGAIGVALAFYFHGKVLFGFYAAIGTLGMLGVVVNDAIVMLNKLDRSKQDEQDTTSFTAGVAKTRLRAIILTTLTTVVGVMPTAYGFGGTDAMLSDMMIALAWGLLFGTLVTLVLTPCFYLFERDLRRMFKHLSKPTLTILLVGLTFQIFPTPIQASESQLSLKEFIQLATKHDTRFHAILIDQHKLKYDQDVNVESPELLASVLTRFNIDSSSIQNDSSLSLSQTLPDLGQIYSAQYAFDAGDDDPHTFSFSFSQDIARNAFGQSVKLDRQLQMVKTDLSRYQIIEAYEDYMAELITLYYTWIRQFESYQLAQSSYKENEKVLHSILKRQKKKIADDTDVNKLKLQIVAKQEQVIRFKKNYLETTRQILRVIQKPISDDIIPDSTITLDKLPEKLDTELTQMRTNRSFAMLAFLSKQSSLEMNRLSRDLMPSIALSASVLQTTDMSGRVGASFGLPFHNKQAKAKFEVSKLNNKKVALTTESTTDILTMSIQNLYLALTTQKELVDTAAQKRQLAANILKSESENYAYGKIDLNDYIQAVNRYDSTRFDEINEKITYQQLSVEWKRITDSLVTNLDS